MIRKIWCHLFHKNTYWEWTKTDFHTGWDHYFCKKCKEERKIHI